jgi:hypothetical protein
MDNAWRDKANPEARNVRIELEEKERQEITAKH